MQSQRTDLEQILLSELECPVCKDYMRPPITMCVNGHNICNICKPGLQHCPICRQQILNTRIAALENLARQAYFPCKYRVYGCRDIYSFHLIGKHQEKCRYRPHVCPVYKLAKGICSWTGSYNDIEEHLKEEHLENCYGHVDLKFRALKNIAAPICVSQFVFAWNEVFYFRFEGYSNIMYTVLQYIGPPENDAKYIYKFEFVNKDDTEGVTVMNLSRPFAESLDDIFRSGNCGKLQFDVLSRLKNEDGTVNFKIEILRVGV